MHISNRHRCREAGIAANKVLQGLRLGRFSKMQQHVQSVWLQRAAARVECLVVVVEKET